MIIGGDYNFRMMIISSSNDLNQQKDHWKVFGSDYLINDQWSFWLTIEYSKLFLHLDDKIVAWSVIIDLLIIIVNGDNDLCYDIDDYDCQNYLNLDDKMATWSVIIDLLIIIVNGDNNLCYDIDDYDCQNYLNLYDKMATWSAIKMLIMIVRWPSAVT